MSVSTILGTRMVTMPNPVGISGGATKIKAAPRIAVGGFSSSGSGSVGLVIECSSRPEKKATAHHKKTRPRKTQAWDIRRGPTVYPPLPPLPPEWTLVTETTADPQSAVSTPEPVES